METPVRHGEVQITCGDEDEAVRLAQALVDRRLAACVHLTPIRSFYVWEEETHDDREVVLSAITRAELLEPIIELVEESHSYDLPAVTIRPLGGSTAYLAWVDDRTS